MMNANVEVVVKSCRIKWISTLQSQIVKDLNSNSEDTLHASRFNFTNKLKTAIFDMLGQALSEVVQYGRASTVFQAGMQSLVQAKFVTDTIVQSVLYNWELIVPIVEKVGKLVDEAVDEHCSVTSNERQKQLPVPICLSSARHSAWQGHTRYCPNLTSMKNFFAALVALVAHYSAIMARKRYRKDGFQYVTPSLTILPNVEAVAAANLSTFAGTEIHARWKSR